MTVGGGSKSDEKSRYFFNLSVEKNLAAPQARKKKLSQKHNSNGPSQSALQKRQNKAEVTIVYVAVPQAPKKLAFIFFTAFQGREKIEQKSPQYRAAIGSAAG